MSVEFDGASRLDFAIGSSNLGQAEGFTFAVLAKTANVTGEWLSLLLNYAASGNIFYRCGLGRRSNHEIYYGTEFGLSSALEWVPGDGWSIVALSKADGSQIPVVTIVPVLEVGAGTVRRSQTQFAHSNPGSQAGGHISFGAVNNIGDFSPATYVDFFKGVAAVLGEFRRALTVDEIVGLQAHRSTIDWDDAGASALWDAADTFAADLTGGGADRTALVGTAPSADDPTDWSYGLDLPEEPPVNRITPAISITTPTPHVALDATSSTGTWLKFPTSYSYQWLRNGVNIGGATSSTYTMQAADEGQQLTVKVAASNGFGSAGAVESEPVVPRAELLPLAPATVLLSQSRAWAPRALRYPTEDGWA